MWLIQCLFYINYDAVCGTFCTLHCIHIFGKMSKINFLKFFNKFSGFNFSSKNFYLGNTKNVLLISVLFNSLTCPLCHCPNNSILTIGYLFMCVVTFDWFMGLSQIEHICIEFLGNIWIHSSVVVTALEPGSWEFKSKPQQNFVARLCSACLP